MPAREATLRTPPRSTRHHAGQAGVHEGGRRIDIEVESRANLRRIAAGEGARRANSGAVDEDVDVASCGGDRGHQAGDGIGLGQIAGDMLDRHPVRGCDGGRCPLQAFRVAGDENQIVASSGKAARQGKTDASRPACDQHDGTQRSRHGRGRHCGRHSHLPLRPLVPEGLPVRPARDRKRLTSWAAPSPAGSSGARPDRRASARAARPRRRRARDRP